MSEQIPAAARDESPSGPIGTNTASETQARRSARTVVFVVGAIPMIVGAHGIVPGLDLEGLVRAVMTIGSAMIWGVVGASFMVMGVLLGDPALPADYLKKSGARLNGATVLPVVLIAATVQFAVASIRTALDGAGLVPALVLLAIAVVAGLGVKPALRRYRARILQSLVQAEPTVPETGAESTPEAPVAGTRGMPIEEMPLPQQRKAWRGLRIFLALFGTFWLLVSSSMFGVLAASLGAPGTNTGAAVFGLAVLLCFGVVGGSIVTLSLALGAIGLPLARGAAAREQGAYLKSRAKELVLPGALIALATQSGFAVLRLSSLPSPALPPGALTGIAAAAAIGAVAALLRVRAVFRAATLVGPGDGPDEAAETAVAAGAAYTVVDAPAAPHGRPLSDNAAMGLPVPDGER